MSKVRTFLEQERYKPAVELFRIYGRGIAIFMTLAGAILAVFSFMPPFIPLMFVIGLGVHKVMRTLKDPKAVTGTGFCECIVYFAAPLIMLGNPDDLLMQQFITSRNQMVAAQQSLAHHPSRLQKEGTKPNSAIPETIMDHPLITGRLWRMRTNRILSIAALLIWTPLLFVGGRVQGLLNERKIRALGSESNRPPQHG